MNIKRRIDGLLSEGRGIQLLGVFLVLILSFFLFLGISKACFRENTFSWQEIIALYLDPGAFGGPGKHDIFRLIVTLLGALLFAALMISIVCNIFDNISDFYKKGEARYNFSHHILILGASNILPEMLKAMSESKDTVSGAIDNRIRFNKKQIVIVTTRPTEELRDEVEAYLDNKRFLKRVTFYFDKRDNKNNLLSACANKADKIYVIGEDDEPCHDLINLNCLRFLREIITISNTECFVVMNSQTTMKSFYATMVGAKDSRGRYLTSNTFPPKVVCKENIINLNECKAEIILEKTIVDGLNFKNGKNIHIVLFGMTSISRALATTVAHSFHFHNRKTIISIVDIEIENKAQDFIMRNSVLFNHCLQSCYKKGDYILSNDVTCSSNISWNFIDDAPSSNSIQEFLKNIQDYSIVYSFVCYDDISKNLATETSLRNRFPGLHIFANFGGFDDALSMEGDGDCLYSKGFKIDLSKPEHFNYIFGSRQQIAQEYYENSTDYTASKTNWNALPIAEKQRIIYESISKKWWSGKDYDPDECSWYSRFLIGIGKKEDGGVYYENHQNYMQLISRHYTYENNPYYSEIRLCNDDVIKNSCELVQNYLINALHNGYEDDTSKFIHYEMVSFQEPDVINDEFMSSIEAFSKTNAISQQLVNNLYEICTNDDCPRRIFKYNKQARIIIQNAAEIGNVYACLILSILCRNNFSEMEEWYIKAIENINQDDSHYIEMFEYYFTKIGSDTTENLYRMITRNHHKAAEFAFDGLINLRIPKALDDNNFDKDYIGTTEQYAIGLTHLNDERLFIRLGSVNGLHNSFKGAWLIKAHDWSKGNNNEVYQKSLILLGDYFNKNNEALAFAYYQEAFECNKQSKELIQKYGRCLYWGIPWDKYNREKAIEIGYNLYIEDKALRLELEERLRKEWEEEYRIKSAEIYDEDFEAEYNSNYDNMIAFEEKKQLLVHEKVVLWETMFPNIKHPYTKITQEDWYNECS